MNEITNLYKLSRIYQYKVINFTPHFLNPICLRDILVKRISPYLVNSRKAAVKKSLAAWSWLISSADAFSEFSC